MHLPAVCKGPALAKARRQNGWRNRTGFEFVPVFLEPYVPLSAATFYCGG